MTTIWLLCINIYLHFNFSFVHHIFKEIELTDISKQPATNQNMTMGENDTVCSI